MRNITAESARLIALAQVRSMDLPACSSPLEALHSFPWGLEVTETMDQRQISEWNLKLDKRSCLGRVALAAALIEDQFPEVTVGYAEVWSDFLRGVMLEQVRQSLPADEQLRTEWLQEVLMYEEPHSVLLIGGEQFDPLSLAYGSEICHPLVQPFPLWEAVASAMMIAEAWLVSDPGCKLTILQEADNLCPGTVTVAENMTSALMLLNREDEAVAMLKEIVAKRLAARTLFVLWLFTEDDSYRHQIDTEYTPYMIEVLNKEGR